MPVCKSWISWIRNCGAPVACRCLPKSLTVHRIEGCLDILTQHTYGRNRCLRLSSELCELLSQWMCQDGNTVNIVMIISLLLLLLLLLPSVVFVCWSVRLFVNIQPMAALAGRRPADGGEGRSTSHWRGGRFRRLRTSAFYMTDSRLWLKV